MKNKITLLLIAAAGIVFLSGCSAITQSTRYSKSTKPAKDPTVNVRFNQEQDSLKNSSDEDSLLATDEDELEDYEVDSSKIYSGELLKRFSASESNIDNDFGTSKDKILMEIIKWMNTPYKFGGNSRKGIDCSAFTQNVFRNSLNFSLLRSAREQFTQGDEIDEVGNLKFGDLVFFNTRRRVRPGHVGIYLGDNIFAHSSSKLGVVVSSLEEGYYNQRFMGGRRMDVILQSTK